MKTALFSVKTFERGPLERLNRDARHEMAFFEQPLDAGAVGLIDGAAAVSVSMHDNVNASVISTLSKAGVRLVTLRCSGYDNVDTIAAVAENVTLMRAGAYSPQAIAEHATALLLGLCRKTHIVYGRTRNNNFSLTGLMGFNLYGKTVGVIGTGNIGSAFCDIMLGFGCRVIAFDIAHSPTLIKKGVVYKSFPEVLHQADILSVHCPLNHTTKDLFDRDAFGKMKSGAVLINTARGQILDTKAAIESLKSGRLGGLGIDVYESEQGLFFQDWSLSPVLDDTIERLLTFPNVIVTPHQGFFTNEAVEAICAATIANLTDFENGRRSANEI